MCKREASFTLDKFCLICHCFKLMGEVYIMSTHMSRGKSELDTITRIDDGI